MKRTCFDVHNLTRIKDAVVQLVWLNDYAQISEYILWYFHPKQCVFQPTPLGADVSAPMSYGVVKNSDQEMVALLCGKNINWERIPVFCLSHDLDDWENLLRPFSFRTAPQAGMWGKCNKKYKPLNQWWQKYF